MNKRILLSAAAVIAFATPAVLAQSTTTSTTPSTTNPPTIADRKTDQQDRIANGHLTAADRAKINNQQNHVSNRIYDDKHNAATDHFGNSEVGTRQKLQQDRIANGVRSGQLTAGETSKLENQQQGINREVKGM